LLLFKAVESMINHKNYNKLFKYFLIATLASLVLSQLGKTASAQTSRDLSKQEVKLFPDWSKFSFSSLDSVGEDGAVEKEVDSIVGWEASREWKADDNIDTVLKLGDLQESLSPQLYSLEDIYDHIEGSNLNLNQETSSIPPDISLQDFSIVGKQSLESLVTAISELGLELASDVQPIADLLVQNGYNNLDIRIEQLINDPQIKDLQLSSIDLQQYKIDSIPGLSDTQLEEFKNYESSNISDVPGLNELPFSDYPNPIQAEISFIGRVDFIWGDAESKANRTISGSKIDGFQVPCDNNCAHLELDDIENFGRKIASGFEGNQWIRGKDHWVNGGTGCLSGGREPTGIHPFGDTFKSVLWDTQESTDSAQVVMYFNIKTKCGDSAYFIGPFPFPLGNIKINNLIFLGSGN
jgi:hypothetical protein